MDLNLWTEEFFLPPDSGLDLLADQNDGLYGDLKSQSRIGGDLKANQPEDVVEQLSALSSPGTLDDLSWMESDISSLLDTLTNQQQQQESSFPPELFDMTSSLPTDSVSQSQLAVFNDILETNMCVSVSQDTMLTPPESPEWVQAVIKLEEPTTNGNDLITSTSISDDTDFLLQDNKDTIQGALVFNGIVLQEEPILQDFFAQPEDAEAQESVDFIDSPLSANDVETMLSSPETSSPPSPSTSSIILSSPELYKVIAAPTNLSNRFSPYPKQKIEQKSKSTKSSRAKKVKLEVDIETEDFAHLNKKDRKRVQNKNAALRYRQKKKVESSTIFCEVESLEDRNQELKTTVEDLEREVRYMKNLMKEIQKAKGLIQ